RVSVPAHQPRISRVMSDVDFIDNLEVAWVAVRSMITQTLHCRGRQRLTECLGQPKPIGQREFLTHSTLVDALKPIVQSGIILRTRSISRDEPLDELYLIVQRWY